MTSGNTNHIFTLFRWSGENSFFIRCDRETLVFGSSEEGFFRDKDFLFRDRESLFRDRKFLFRDKKYLLRDRKSLFRDRKWLSRDRIPIPR